MVGYEDHLMLVDMVVPVVDMILQQETLDQEVIKGVIGVMHLLDIHHLVKKVRSFMVVLAVMVIIVPKVAAVPGDTTAAVAAVVVLSPMLIQVIVDQVMAVAEVVMSIRDGLLN